MEYVSPGKVQEVVIQGFKRMEHYCRARAMFFKSYVGRYYREVCGIEGEEPLNLVFNTISSYVPALIMKNPITHTTSPYVAYRETAELLGLALDEISQQTKEKEVLRQWVTNALFGWGIIKTGVKAKGDLVLVDDVMVDKGQIYAKNLALHNYGFDPAATSLRDARAQWHRTVAPRQMLLDLDDYDHDTVMKLPTVDSLMSQDEIAGLSRTDEGRACMARLQDEVYVVEMYVPEIEQIVTMGDPTQLIQKKYLRVADFNGPKEGPYHHLSFTPPVEDNPFPVAPVGIWYDLAVETNRVFKKILDQIHNQKDVGLYHPNQSETIDMIEDSNTGDWVPSMDPKGINVVSFGGQNTRNEAALAQLQTWYNYMSGNPDLISGAIAPGSGAGSQTATGQQIQQSNASITLRDMQDILYDRTAEVKRSEAWHLWYDPLIKLPISKRISGDQYVQLFFTPEQRQGDFLDYAFKIKERSMEKLDPMMTSKRIQEFAVNVIPAGVQAALMMMQMGRPFNLEKYLTLIAQNWGVLDELDAIFDDPEHEQRMEIFMQLGAQNEGKGQITSAGVRQNQGNPIARPTSTRAQDANRFAQETAAIPQSMNAGMFQ